MGEHAERKLKPKAAHEEPARRQSKPSPKPRFVDPLLAPATSRLSFPAQPVGAIASQKVAIVNSDSRPLVLDAITPTSVDPFSDFEIVAPRSVQIAPNEQTEVEVQFRASRAGEFSQTFQLMTDVGPVGPEGDIEAHGVAKEWAGQQVESRLASQNEEAARLEQSRAVDPQHAARSEALRGVDQWAQHAKRQNQQLTDWTRDNWLEFTSLTGGDYTLQPSGKLVGVVKTIVSDWCDLTLEIEAPENLLAGATTKLVAKHAQEAVIDYFFDKMSGVEKVPVDEQLNGVAKSVGTAAVTKTRELDGYRDRADLVVEDTRSAAALRIERARDTKALQVWQQWASGQRVPDAKQLHDRSLRDALLAEWLLQHSATPDSANRSTNPVAWKDVKRRMEDSGQVPTLERQDLFIHQCAFEWNELGFVDVDTAVGQLDERRQRYNRDARSWGNDPKGASRMVAAFLGASDQTRNVFRGVRDPERTARIFAEPFAGAVNVAMGSPADLAKGMTIDCTMSLEAKGEGVFVKFFRYRATNGDTPFDVIRTPRSA
jgi:hypothetical protein